MLGTWPLLALALAGPAQAGSEAESCIQTKTWANYESGYSLRTTSHAGIEIGARLTLKSTFYRGREYLIQACGGATTQELDLILFNLQGQEVARVDGAGKQPTLRHKSAQTETLYIVAHLRAAAAGEQDVSIGLFYK
jgi:hypothetical protein